MAWRGGRSVSDKEPMRRRYLRSDEFRDSVITTAKLKDAAVTSAKLDAGTKADGKVVVGSQDDSGMGWQYPHDSSGLSVPQGIFLVDDFLGQETESGEFGSLPWAELNIGAGGQITKVAPGTTGWKEMGLVQLTANGSSATGTALSLGDNTLTPLKGPPPTGFRCSVKVAVPGTSTQFTAWLGLWKTVTVEPDAATSNTATGIGFTARALGSTVKWFGMVRNGTSESTVDLDVDADGTFRFLGWRKTAGGIFFQVNGVDVGSEVTSNLPGSSDGIGPGMAIINKTGASRSIQVDWFSLSGSLQRY